MDSLISQSQSVDVWYVFEISELTKDPRSSRDGAGVCVSKDNVVTRFDPELPQQPGSWFEIPLSAGTGDVSSAFHSVTARKERRRKAHLLEA